MVLGADNLPVVIMIAGVVLMVLEALAPGANFIVLGVALLSAGLAGVVLNPLLGGGALIAAMAALTFIFGATALYIYREFEFYTGTDSGATSDSASLSGQTGRVTERVTQSAGQVKLDDGGFNPHYQARSVTGEIPEGETVIVVDPGGGNVLTVESLSGIEPDSIDRALDREEASDNVQREPEEN